MAELKIEGSFEEQMGVIKSALIQHHAAINGNGQPGLLDFMSGIKAQLRLIIVLLSVGGLIISLLAFLEAQRQIKQGILRVDAPVVAAQSTTSDWRH